MRIKNKLGQQEIVGFVLIVVVVMIALMIFLIMSVRNSAESDGESLEISNMISAMMRGTTECAVIYEPDYDSYEDLFKSCYKGSSCSNLERGACDYLNESFGEMLDELMRSEGDVNGYRVDFYVKDGYGLMDWGGGNCSSFNEGALRTFISRSSSLVVRMRVC
jgi:hypothetical protein